VFRGAPAPTNLKVPPYTLADGTLLIGEDKETKGA
jgi:Rieske Fe-S protein